MILNVKTENVVARSSGLSGDVQYFFKVLKGEETGFGYAVIHIEYREWFFGHWHIDWKEGKFRALWNEIAELKNYTKRLITYCRKMKIRVLYFY